MPLTVEEYQIGQAYSTCEASLAETGGGEGIEILKNEPFTNVSLLGGQYSAGQYTHKIFHIKSKVPAFIRMLVPNGAMDIHEEAWNAYPYCRTVVTNPGYMKENFYITIESLHLPDHGDKQNVHNLPHDKLKEREVVMIDIANDPVNKADYKPTEDPTKFKSTKTGRGPLTGKWTGKAKPVMTCYKLVTIKFKWFGLQGRIENFVQKSERRIFLNFHRQVFCWIDQWHAMTMEEVRAIEERVRKDLDCARKQGKVRGTRGSISE